MLIGFESDGGEEVGNGREEETRKKREKRGSKRELTGTWMGAGRRDLSGFGPKLEDGSLGLLTLSLFGCVSPEFRRKRHTRDPSSSFEPNPNHAAPPPSTCR